MAIQKRDRASRMNEEATKNKPSYVPEDPGLKVDEVAAELGIDRSSARRLIISQIPHYIVAAGKRKKSYRVRKSVLMRWRESQERQSLKRSNRLSLVNGDQANAG
jgi:hypothetical protein